MTDDGRLKEETRKSISEPRTSVYVSAASIWEISIKTGLGKIELGKVNLIKEIAATDFLELAISGRHAWLAGQLPAHHNDPFDRLLLAQARIENLVLVTHDRRFSLYDVSLLLA